MYYMRVYIVSEHTPTMNALTEMHTISRTNARTYVPTQMASKHGGQLCYHHQRENTATKLVPQMACLAIRDNIIFCIMDYIVVIRLYSHPRYIVPSWIKCHDILYHPG